MWRIEIRGGAARTFNRLACIACVVPSIAWSTAAAAAPPVADTTPTSAQISTFADIVDDTSDGVTQRLRSDANLGARVVKAVQTRDDRKRTGMALIVAGGVVLVGAGIAGSLIIVTAPGYPEVGSNQSGRVLLGLGVDLVGVGVGLALGIPGIVKVSARSDEENQAIDYYRRAGDSVPRAPPPAPPSPGFVMSLPIVSGSF